MESNQAVEVEFEDALAEEQEQEGTRPRPGPSTQAEDIQNRAEQAEQAEVIDQVQEAKQAAEEDIDALVAKTSARKWIIGPEGAQREYFQEELSVIGEIQWLSLLGEFLDKAMSGDGAISINALLSPPTPRTPGRLSPQDFQEADTFIHALGKLLVFAPEFMEKSICIWLAVPDYEWDLIREYMKMSPNRGGMSHDMFEEILATFIDQNYAAIDRFFRERSRRLRARYQARRSEASQSRS